MQAHETSCKLIELHVILVSALGPNPSFFLFWGTFIQLGVCWDSDLDLDQGLKESWKENLKEGSKESLKDS